MNDRFRHRARLSRTTAVGRTSPFPGEGRKVWNRRVSLTAARPVEGLLSEATAGIQLASSELVFMPHCGRSLKPAAGFKRGGDLPMSKVGSGKQH
jgi:hypothetical protein